MAHHTRARTDDLGWCGAAPQRACDAHDTHIYLYYARAAERQAASRSRRIRTYAR
jgi:hypothetical protein